MLVAMRFLLESCLEIGLSAMITVLMLDDKNFENLWEGVSTALAFVSLLVLLIVPIYQSTAVYQFRKDRQLAKEK